MKLFIAALVLLCTVTSTQAQIYARVESNQYQSANQSPIVTNRPANVARPNDFLNDNLVKNLISVCKLPLSGSVGRAYTISRPPGLRMRNTGRMLTIIGGAMLIGGIIVYSNADLNYYNSYTTSTGTYTEGDPQAALGVLMIAGGAGMTVPGIIFWSKGAKKYKRHLEREAAFNFRGRDVSLTYRF